MDWLNRRRSSPELAAATSAPGPLESATPGVAALLGGASQERSHSVLDLGPAADSSLRVYGEFARWVRFANLFAEVASGKGWAGALPAQPEPYDLVFGWDILDRLFPEERPHLMERLVDVTTAGAWLHVVVDASEEPLTQPHRFALLEANRLIYEPAGPLRPARRRLPSAEVARLLAPFRVVHAFTLKAGFREYVAVR